MRVLFMAGSMEPGGSERQTLLLLRYLNRSRFQPFLFLRHGRGVWLSSVPEDVPVLAYEAGESGPAGASRATSRFHWPGRELKTQIRFLTDCITTHHIDVIYDRTFHMTMLAGPASARTGVPHVSTVVTIPQLAFPHFEKKYRWLKKRQLVRAYRNADRVVGVSAAAARAAESFYGLPADLVTIIPNPLDRERLQKEAQPTLAWGPAPDCTNLICVGRLDPHKGQEDLLLALARLTDRPWHLWLLGDGPLRGKLQKAVEPLGLADRVTFLGHVDHGAAIVSQCQLLILPSRFEGMPNVVLEAMALGVPVIATDAGGTSELVDGGRFGTLVPLAEPAALSEAVAAFLDDPAFHQQRARLAREEVVRRHDIAVIVPRIETLLREVVQQRRAAKHS